MTEDHNLDAALKNLEEGKFSFQMVGCINQCIQKQRAELDELQAFHAKATKDLAQYERKIVSLERNLRIANSTIFGLIKTNALLEQGAAATKYGVVKFAEVSLPIIQQAAAEVRPYAIEAVKYAWAVVKKAVDVAEPQVKAWWAGLEPRLKELTKANPQSSPKSQK